MVGESQPLGGLQYSRADEPSYPHFPVPKPSRDYKLDLPGLKSSQEGLHSAWLSPQPFLSFFFSLPPNYLGILQGQTWSVFIATVSLGNLPPLLPLINMHLLMVIKDHSGPEL